MKLKEDSRAEIAVDAEKRKDKIIICHEYKRRKNGIGLIRLKKDLRK